MVALARWTVPFVLGFAWFLPSSAQTVTDSLVDQSNAATCLEASTVPGLGLLVPLSMELNVSSATGNVGIGVADAPDKLTVDGEIRCDAGGYRFPDGSLLAVATPQGSPGPQGPDGPQGPPGPEGNPGLTQLNGQGGSGSSVAIVGSGGVSVSASGSNITVNYPTPTCTYENLTYSAGQRCYMRPYNCSATTQQGNFLTCQSDGSWVLGTLFCTSNYPTSPICGE